MLINHRRKDYTHWTKYQIIFVYIWWLVISDIDKGDVSRPNYIILLSDSSMLHYTPFTDDKEGFP